MNNSWGRGHPDEYTEAINLGGDDSRYDPMDDKKPRAGQILWIRGLTRLQTQVSNHANIKTPESEISNPIKQFSTYFPKRIFLFII